MLRIGVIDNGIGSLDAFPADDITQIHALKTGAGFVDNLTAWLCGVRPEGGFEVLPECYGIPSLVGTVEAD